MTHDLGNSKLYIVEGNNSEPSQVRCMNQTVPHRILVIDPENLFGELLAFVLKYYYNDTTQIVRSRDAGWVSLEAELADAVFIYLHADGVKVTTGCLRGLKSILYTINAHERGLRKATVFCQQLRLIPKFEHVPVIVFGSREPKQIYTELQEAGATGYLFVPCTTEEMMAARDAALRGETYYP